MTRRSPTLGTILALAAIWLPGGCGRPVPAASPQASSRPPVSITTARSSLRTVVRSVEITGTLEPADDVILAAKVPGRVVELHADLGDRVQSGTPLVQLDETDYVLVVNQSRAAMEEVLARLGITAMPDLGFSEDSVPSVVRAKLASENAEAKFRRVEALSKQTTGAISEQDYADQRMAWETAVSDLAVARQEVRSLVALAHSRDADLASARQRLSDTRITAPRATHNASRLYGVAARNVSVGSYVREGEPLMRLVISDPIKFRGSAPERFAGRIKPGQRVSIATDSKANLVGVVTRVSPQIDPQSRAFELEAEIPNPSRDVKPGGFGRAAVETHADDGVTFVPAASILEFAGVKRVFAIRGDTVKEHRVQTGLKDGEWIEIAEGFSGDQEVAITALPSLADGTAVTKAK